MKTCKLIGRRAHRLSKQSGKPLVRHRQASTIVKIGHVQPERAVQLQIYQMVENKLDIFWLPVRSQAHHFILARIDLEAEIIGEGRIEEPERVREMNLLDDV